MSKFLFFFFFSILHFFFLGIAGNNTIELGEEEEEMETIVPEVEAVEPEQKPEIQEVEPDVEEVILDDTDDKIVDVDTSKDELTENFVCQDCESCFESKSGLKQHRELFHDAKTHACAICDEAFETLDQLKQHFLQVHEKSAKNSTRKRQNSQFYQCLVCQVKSTSART